VNPRVEAVHARGQHRPQPGRDVDGEATALRPVKDRHKLSDGRGEQDPAGPQDTPRFVERRDPLSSTHEVVERAEQEHCVDRRIRLRESAGIADLGGHQPLLKCGSDMPWDDVDKMHAVAPAAPRAQTPNGRRNSVVDAKPPHLCDKPEPMRRGRKRTGLRNHARARNHSCAIAALRNSSRRSAAEGL
jgi:hypothetical protein